MPLGSTDSGVGVLLVASEALARISTQVFKLTQGINPRIYLLERHVSGPIGRKDKIETVVEVRYSEHTRLLYDLVHILPDGIDVRIERTA